MCRRNSLKYTSSLAHYAEIASIALYVRVSSQMSKDGLEGARFGKGNIVEGSPAKSMPRGQSGEGNIHPQSGPLGRLSQDVATLSLCTSSRSSAQLMPVFGVPAVNDNHVVARSHGHHPKSAFHWSHGIILLSSQRLIASLIQCLEGYFPPDLERNKR